MLSAIAPEMGNRWVHHVGATATRLTRFAGPTRTAYGRLKTPPPSKSKEP